MYFVEVRESSGRGRGVFALKNFKKGDVIEVCPIVYISQKEDLNIQETILGKYIYEWRENDGAIILGYGSIYNHSFAPNATYSRDFKNITLVYKAWKKIGKGDEIFVNYNGNPRDKNPVDDFLPIDEPLRKK